MINSKDCDNTFAEVIIRNNISYTPKVSVVIPIYNSSEYLIKTLDSVINQTLQDIEIICVDDGSTDNSLDIIKQYAINDSRITILKQENYFAGIARNAGISVAKGEFIYFLDSDDWITEQMLEKTYNIAKEKTLDVLIFAYSEYDQKK